MDLVAYVRVSKVGDRDGDPFGARTSSGEPIRRTLRRTLRRTTTAQRVPPRALIVAARHSVGGHTNLTTNAFHGRRSLRSLARAALDEHLKAGVFDAPGLQTDRPHELVNLLRRAFAATLAGDEHV
jgi:hypothetical protein